MWYATTVGWTLSEHAVKTFSKNTLATVVVQLRFHPILKTTEHYADFQEKLRPRFPGYEAVETQMLEVNFGSRASPAGVVRSGRTHRFIAVDEPTVASLEPTSVSIEYAAHKERATLIKDVGLVLDALNAYGPVPVRLGLRYVNIIEQKNLAAHFGAEIPWAQLLTPAFASIPGGLASIDTSTNYLAEVTAPRDPGKMTVKYGLLMARGAKDQHFRLDTDRFVEGTVKIGEVPGLLERFSDDIFQVFMMAAGPKLIEWMEAAQ